MKTLAELKLRTSTLTVAVLLGFFMLLLPSLADAQQVPAKDKKQKEKMGEATLEEAKVTARVVTSVEEVGPMKVKLNVLNPTGKPVRLSILNYANEPVYQDAFKEREYNKVLNFNSTVPGRYSLHVKGPKQPEETRRFKIDSKEERTLTQSELESRKTSDVMATIYKTAPNQIMLTLVNNTGEVVDYLIRNEARETLYQGRVKDAKFSKMFDMSAVPNGKYTFEVQYKADKVAARNFDMQTVYERSFAWVDKKGKPLPAANKPAPAMSNKPAN
jgi:hypothetical protein